MKARLLALVLVFFGIPCFAQEPVKVAVLPWSIDRSLQGEVTERVGKVISSKPGFALSAMKFGGTEEDARNFFQSEGFPYPKKEEAYDADILVFVSGKEGPAQKHIAVVLAGVETGKELRYLIPEEKLSSGSYPGLIADAVSKGLDRAGNDLLAHADEVLDPDKSAVRYVFTGKHGRKVYVDVDYTAGYQDIQNVALSMEDLPAEGGADESVAAVEGGNLMFTFFSKGGTLQAAKIDTDVRPKTPEEKETRCAIKSDGGYLMDFTFSWNGQEVESVNVKPRVNPNDPPGPFIVEE